MYIAFIKSYGITDSSFATRPLKSVYYLELDSCNWWKIKASSRSVFRRVSKSGILFEIIMKLIVNFIETAS